MALKNITLSADPDLIERARLKAESRDTTLNNEFRRWLTAYSSEEPVTAEQIREAVAPLRYFRAGRRLSREERNER